MWTNDGREALLKGLFDQIKDGAQLVFFVNDEELLIVDMPAPVAEIKNGLLIFNETDGVSVNSGTPTHAVLTSEGVNLLSLPIPDVLKLEPSDVIAGSVIKVERFIIR